MFARTKTTRIIIKIIIHNDKYVIIFLSYYSMGINISMIFVYFPR